MESYTYSPDPPKEPMEHEDGKGNGHNEFKDTPEQPDYVHLLPPDKKNGRDKSEKPKI